ncbi:hypothetical protein TrVE_jg1615 [Triparma verrucosa]|uniref:Non-haem dioxygenase N-terminal domain-containing protein n=1 Tax=Triparma verrucosa TaxID=1606542 RepID=A0A9W7KUC6_9STRA|nr:hypothetical protein TrVE_jg1615 [Triparma verrucosa]
MAFTRFMSFISYSYVLLFALIATSYLISASSPPTTTATTTVPVANTVNPLDIPKTVPCVTITYTLLKSCATSNSTDLLPSIKSAYGYTGFGILAVTGVPGLKEKRLNLLPLIERFANLPDSVKKSTETPHASYQVGWSHGNEKLVGSTLDFSKGSYYCNPLYDYPSTNETLIKLYPSFLEPNIWPTSSIPEFENAFKSCGRTMVEVGIMLSKQCDAYVKSECPTYATSLSELIKTSKCCKGRLLHYFPQNETSSSSEDDFSSWCGWHNDHGSLTSLLPPIYTDSNGEQINNPDTKAGLYVRSRSGQLIKVNIPSDDGTVLYQIGECSQVMSGGVLQATPHAVRGVGGGGVSRQTFAVFMEPEYDGEMRMPEGKGGEDVQGKEAVERLPEGIRKLEERWEEGVDFGEFSRRTFAAFY